MVAYHPSDIELTEFSAGTLPWALSIAMAAHIHFCPQCKARISELNAIGGQMIASTGTHCTAAPLSNESLNKALARIRESKSGAEFGPTENHNPKKDSLFERLPKAVQKIIGDPKKLSWSFVSPSLRAARLTTGQNQYEVSLHRIKKGGSVAEHNHRGLEVVVVLDGSFSDENGSYKPGDYIVKNVGECHRPTATMDKDCLCLSIVEAPVALTGILGKFINPFLRVRPS